MTETDPIWLFDSVCALCSRGVQYALRFEREPRMRFVAIQSAIGRDLAKRYGVDPDEPDTFLFIENGQALEKSDAVIALSRHLGGPARIASLFRFLPERLRDAAYELIARNRYRVFGKRESCLVPAADQRDRFVL